MGPKFNNSFYPILCMDPLLNITYLGSVEIRVQLPYIDSCELYMQRYGFKFKAHNCYSATYTTVRKPKIIMPHIILSEVM